MRIVHVNLARGFRGGERQTALLIRALADRGLEQALVAREDSPVWVEVEAVRGFRAVPVRRPFLRVAPAIRRWRPDLIHAHEAKAGQWARLSQPWLGAPYLITRRMIRRPGGDALTRSVYGEAAAVVALSSAIRRDILAYHPGLAVPVIPSMCAGLRVSPGLRAEIRERYRGRFLVGHIGAMTDEKGHATLLGAVARLAPRHDELRFVLIGEGPLRPQLERQAEGLPVDFVGFTTEVGAWLAAMDLFAFPSLSEGLGSTLLDAMEAGKPIVASGVGGIPDVIDDGVNGLLVPPGEVDPLAAAIARLYQDGALRSRLAEAGRERVEAYRPAVIAERYESLYERCVRGEPVKGTERGDAVSPV